MLHLCVAHLRGATPLNHDELIAEPCSLSDPPQLDWLPPRCTACAGRQERMTTAGSYLAQHKGPPCIPLQPEPEQWLRRCRAQTLSPGRSPAPLQTADQKAGAALGGLQTLQRASHSRSAGGAGSQRGCRRQATASSNRNPSRPPLRCRSRFRVCAADFSSTAATFTACPSALTTTLPRRRSPAGAAAAGCSSGREVRVAGHAPAGSQGSAGQIRGEAGTRQGCWVGVEAGTLGRTHLWGAAAGPTASCSGDFGLSLQPKRGLSTGAARAKA